MADELDGLALDEARELRGRGVELWLRRLVLLAFLAMPILALFNVFGQSATVASASSSVAKLSVRSPTHARGGLLYEARFTIEAHRDIKNATVDLGGGWANGLTFNAIEPQPSQESSQHGELALQLGSLSAGDTFVLHLYYQVNPTTTGSRKQQVALLDGDTPLVSLTRHLTVYP
jgi:hypothetical protein